MNTKVALMLISNIILLVIGQGCWKLGIQKVPDVSLDTVKPLLMSPYIWAGVLLYFFGTIIWLKILSMIPLSIAYPLQSTAYILGIFMALIFFKEVIPWTRWLGCLIIMIGVYIISLK